MMQKTIDIKGKIFLVMLLGLLSLTAKGADGVEWTADAVSDTGNAGHIVVTAKVADGYHFYSFAPEGGYNSLEIKVGGNDAVLSTGDPSASIAPETHYEESQGAELSSWSKDVSFTIPFTFEADKGYKINLKIRYQACDSTACLTPKTVNLTLTGNGYAESENSDTAEAAQANQTENGEGNNGELTTDAAINTQWWSPVKTTTPTTDQSPWAILVLGFVGGLAALLTPCVWPLIPMTLSFFLRRKAADSIPERSHTEPLLW